MCKQWKEVILISPCHTCSCPGRKHFSSRLNHGLEGSLSASIFDCVFDSVGIILFSDDFYGVHIRDLERSWLVSVLLSPALCNAGWSLERSLSACLSDDSYAVYTRGLERSWLVLFSPASCVGWGLGRSLSTCAHTHGLERTGWMVLKGLKCNCLVPQLCFAIYFQAMVLKGISGVSVCFVFYNRLGNIFA